MVRITVRTTTTVLVEQQWNDGDDDDEDYYFISEDTKIAVIQRLFFSYSESQTKLIWKTREKKRSEIRQGRKNKYDDGEDDEETMVMMNQFHEKRESCFQINCQSAAARQLNHNISHKIYGIWTLEAGNCLALLQAMNCRWRKRR